MLLILFGGIGSQIEVESERRGTARANVQSERPRPTSTGEYEDLIFTHRMTALQWGLLQYPVHLYFAVALRVSNIHFLEGESENSWTFGQIIAMVLLGNTLLQCWVIFHSKLPPPYGIGNVMLT